MSTCYEYKFLGPGKNSPEKRSGITGLVVGKTVRSLRYLSKTKWRWEFFGSVDFQSQKTRECDGREAADDSRCRLM